MTSLLQGGCCVLSLRYIAPYRFYQVFAWGQENVQAWGSLISTHREYHFRVILMRFKGTNVLNRTIYALLSTIMLGFACFDSVCRFSLHEPSYVNGMKILRPCG